MRQTAGPLIGLAFAGATAAALFLPVGAYAKSWCAYPLWVHEWGVHVYGSDGQPSTPAPLPPFFVGPTTTARAHDVPVPARDLPIDGGEREIPILQFYAADRREGVIPVGLEVGFTGGPATRWYPDVDLLRTAADANSPLARAARARLVAERAARAARRMNPAPSADPTRQLIWDRLELTAAPAHPAAPSTEPWVRAARGGDALWVNAGKTSERFVFYEATTAEPLPLRLTRGPTWAPGRRHYVLANTGPHPIHDVFVVQRDGAHTYVFFAPKIPAAASAGFVLEDHRVDGRVRAATWDHLRTLLVDPAASSAPNAIAGSPAPGSEADPRRAFAREYSWDLDSCVMQRDPAVPVEAAEGHRLYAAEVDTLLGLWGARFFERPGTTIVYREDLATLDQAMPLSVYTDMFHFVRLRRAGLALWEAPPLP